MAAALHSAVAILLALEYRRRTGRGQWIDLAQYEVACLAAAEPLLQHLAGGPLWERRGNRHPCFAPHNIYPCAPVGSNLPDDDQWVAIAVEHDEEWPRLAAIVGGDLAGRPDLRTAAGRKAAEEEIDAAVAAWTASRTAEAVAAGLQAAGVRAAAVRRYDQVSRDPQLWHRGFWQRATSRELGPRLYLGPWARLHRTPGRIRSAAPGFAEHNRFVLCGLLGLSEAQYQGLLARGATSEELSGFARPASAGLTAEEELALGDTRGFDPDYQALNRAGPAVPHVPEPPVQWLAAPISSRTGR